jgi:hypothetical protein
LYRRHDARTIGRMAGITRWLGLGLLLASASLGGRCLAGPCLCALADLPAAASHSVATDPDLAGRIIVPVTINGRGPFRFMVDTGANRTVLAQSLLQRLDLPLDHGSMIEVAGVNGSVAVASAHVAHLDSGALHFLDVQLPVLSGPVFDGIDGILGMDGFDGMRVSADFLKDRFTIADSHWRAPFMFSVLRVQFLSARLLMIDGHVGHVATKAIIDTGALHTLGNPALLRALSQRAGDMLHRLQAGVIDVNEASQLGSIGSVPPVRLGTTTINDLSVAFGDFSVFHTWGLDDTPALLIGMDVLGTLAQLNIDYQRRELQLRTRHDDADRQPFLH